MTTFDATTAAELVRRARTGQPLSDDIDDILATRELTRAIADQLEAACAEVERLTLAHGNVLLELHQCAKERLETAVNLDEENTILTGEVMSLSSQLSTALHERDEARGECERLRYVVDAARKWRDTPHIPNSNHYAGDHDQCVEAKRAEDDFWESVDNIEKAG
jgi:hypothetical protein